MRSLSTLSGPVYRIVFGTAALLGIGSLLTLAASQSSSGAVASPSDMGFPDVTYGGATSPMGDFASWDEQAAMSPNSSDESALEIAGGGPSIHCCRSSGGSCSMYAGSGCPSGSSATQCPCNPDAM